MPTLKEIKGRIGSVKSTLKITSAMKLVSSAKLRKAQVAIESMRPYEAQLQRILAAVSPSHAEAYEGDGANISADALAPSHASAPRVIIAIASNSSLCGGFNANAIAKVRSLRRSTDVVYSVGRKMADAMRKDGFPSPGDFSALSEHPAYAPAADLASRLMKDFFEGRIGKVLLVYNHYVSSSKQVPVVETFLPAGEMPGQAGNDGTDRASDYILEPSAKEIVERLLPKTIKLKLYTVLLDSAAAEHAARTIAMQTATDNGNELLEELTLQYNKGRQQKITSEILDLAGGQNQE